MAEAVRADCVGDLDNARVIGVRRLQAWGLPVAQEQVPERRHRIAQVDLLVAIRIAADEALGASSRGYERIEQILEQRRRGIEEGHSSSRLRRDSHIERPKECRF
jgi:hypothetical protein